MHETLLTTPVERLAAREPVRVRASTPVLEVVHSMRAAGQGAVLVVGEDDQRLIGILTERDLVRASVETDDESWLGNPVAQWMRPDPTTVRAGDSLATVIRRMNAVRFRRLPVLDADGRAVGLVSIRDLLAYLAESFPEELANLPPDPAHEAKRRWGG